VHATPFVYPGHVSALAVPATQGLAQLQTPEPNEHAPGARKFGLGAMLAAGFEIERTLVTGGLLIVVVVVGATVVGATVVGVTTVFGGGVVVALGEPFDVDRGFTMDDTATTRECRVSTVMAPR
jgi:hypothetical protein